MDHNWRVLDCPYTFVLGNSSLYHNNRYLSATVSAGLAPGKSINDGIDAMNEIKGICQPKVKVLTFKQLPGGTCISFFKIIDLSAFG